MSRYTLAKLLLKKSITFRVCYVGAFCKRPLSIKVFFIGDFINIHTFISWKDLKINHKEVTGISLLILFIGRILVAYGIYQTIQAFRKFGKS